MARAGFTAITSGALRFGRDGQWYTDDEVIGNPAICRLFSRALQVSADGRARLELGGEKADVIIEDTPWVVTAVEGTPASGFTVVLNDDSREALDATSLAIGAAHVLYCRVKGGPHRARFLRPAYYALMAHVEPGPGGTFALRAGERRVTLPPAR